MKIFTFTVNPFQQNTYLLVSDGKALLVDAGFNDATETARLEDTLLKEKATLIGVLLTHAHIDHILGLQRVLDRFDVPVYLSHIDLYLWENFYSQAAMYGIPARPHEIEPEDFPTEGIFETGPFRMMIFYTPGHSPDHVSFYFENDGVLLAGDVLFRQSIGRTDLYKGDFELLSRTIREKLYVLPDSTRVLPGHGPETTIGFEKKNNPFVSL